MVTPSRERCGHCRRAYLKELPAPHETEVRGHIALLVFPPHVSLTIGTVEHLGLEHDDGLVLPVGADVGDKDRKLIAFEQWEQLGVWM
jgi:hypothetical protein